MKVSQRIIALAWFLIASTAYAQQGVSDSPVSDVAASGLTITDLPAAGQPASVEDVFQRLQRAESRLEELESERIPQVDAPMAESMLQFFTVYDPEIEIAREQEHTSPIATIPAESAAPKKWYDKLSIRGYAQFRINEQVVSHAGSAPAQYIGDRSIGDDQSFLIRRARVILSGNVHKYLYVYLQPDFASNVPGSNDNTYYTQVRDWYGDVYLDSEMTNRIRVGQSKIPFGWENLQSSSNRIPLDRNDGLNSAVRNERDLGVIYYWTPTWAQTFFKEVLEEGLKGSGNYGVFGLGVYNGQGGSLLELNDNLHVVSRLTLPIQLANCQRMEIGVQGYYGQYAVTGSTIDPPGAPGPSRPIGTVDFTSSATLEATSIYRNGWDDKRIGGTFVWYPQPLGFQAEWNVGRGPALNAAQTALENRSLTGGYGMVMYKIDQRGTWFPYARYSYYQGGYKTERNAPFVQISEWEFGTEWQISTAAELTLSYLTTDRTNTTASSLAGSQSYGQFTGDVLRDQFQINY